jgi:hypothetical protein
VCSSDVYGPGQYDRRDKNRNAFYLPQARSLCKVKLTFGGKKILAVEPGPAFDPAEWKHIRGDVEKALLSGAPKVGREYSFCTFRATGWCRGTRSGVQIIQPPEDAPRAGLEGADHPFILEFPLKASALQEITNQRRIRVHRQLTLLLNILLRGDIRPSCYLDRGTFGQPISIMGLRANGFVGGLHHRYDRVA